MHERKNVPPLSFVLIHRFNFLSYIPLSLSLSSHPSPVETKLPPKHTLDREPAKEKTNTHCASPVPTVLPKSRPHGVPQNYRFSGGERDG
jgi:hypothetical protein